jgi:membrane protein implicated in regulation of membrane protease activity
MKTKTPLWYTVQAIVGTLVEEAALVIIVLWGLPHVGIHVPWWGLAILMAGLAVVAYATYRIGKGTFAVRHKGALEALVGGEGKVVKPLAPVGYVKIRGELWKAVCEESKLEVGDKVIVVGVDGMMLIVRLKASGEHNGI